MTTDGVVQQEDPAKALSLRALQGFGAGGTGVMGVLRSLCASDEFGSEDAGLVGRICEATHNRAGKPVRHLQQPSRQLCRVMLERLTPREFAKGYIDAFGGAAKIRPSQVRFLADRKIFMTAEERKLRSTLRNGQKHLFDLAWRGWWLASLRLVYPEEPRRTASRSPVVRRGSYSKVPG